MADIYFPTTGFDNNAKPLINFKCKDPGGPSIYMPTPAGVTFADSGTFSTIDLGKIGSFNNIEDVKKLLDAKDTGAENSGIAGVKATVIAGVKQLIGGDKGALLIASTGDKTIMNPNTNTTFTGNAIRTYTFQFTLVGRTEGDTEAIRQIHNGFREFMYPESTFDGANLILKYPPVWNLFFFDGNNNKNTGLFPKKTNISPI